MTRGWFNAPKTHFLNALLIFGLLPAMLAQDSPPTSRAPRRIEIPDDLFDDEPIPKKPALPPLPPFKSPLYKTYKDIPDDELPELHFDDELPELQFDDEPLPELDFSFIDQEARLRLAWQDVVAAILFGPLTFTIYKLERDARMYLKETARNWF